MNVWFDVSYVINYDISTHFIVWTSGMKGDTFLY